MLDIDGLTKRFGSKTAVDAASFNAQEPAMIGSIKGQDFTKGIIIIMIILGVLLEIFGIHWFSDVMSIS